MMPGRIEKTLSPKAPTQAHANKVVILLKFGTGPDLPASTLPNGWDIASDEDNPAERDHQLR
jgi:hypothetical protein